MSTIRFEAEDMALNGYRLESKGIASGGKLISLVGGGAAETGTASFEFAGAEGLYQVVLGYFDETDGVSQLTINYPSGTANLQFDQQLGSDVANQRTKVRKTITSELWVKPGDAFTIKGWEDGGEPARVDYMEFISVDNGNEPLNISTNMSTIRFEAEDMALNGYRLESKGIASGGKLISFKNRGAAETGTASFEFAGAEGWYQVVVGYFDENDGVSRLTIDHPSGTANLKFDQQLGSDVANQQTKVRKTIVSELWVKPGDAFTITGKEDLGEPARLDYMEFIPVDNGNEPLNGGNGNEPLNGGSANDSVDYSQAVNGIIANLKKGEVLKPLFGTMNQPKIMAIGDSITAGEGYSDPTTPGAYRIKLWNKFEADGLNVDFVGSQNNGPPTIDPDHEGHPGWTIKNDNNRNDITGLVDNGLLATYQPNVILLMIGTNDILRWDQISTLETELSQLIDKITRERPNAHLLVSSVAPLDPSAPFGSSTIRQTRANRVNAYNNLIPQLVEEKAAQGKQITYVNAGGSLSLDDINPDGIHPTSEGYDQIGNKFYNALVDRDTLSSGIKNIKGTAFNDRLTGDGNNNKLTGGGGADTLTGGGGADTLIGGGGADVLTGGGGADVLTGGGGADSFTYKNPNQGPDEITDFNLRENDNDRLVISAAGFGGGLAQGFLNPSQFTLGSSASDTSDRFIYNSNNGNLFFDADGTDSSNQLLIATLTNKPNLVSNDIFVAV